MGWYFWGKTRGDVVKELLESNEKFRVVAHADHGRTFWRVVEYETVGDANEGESRRLIVLDLIEPASSGGGVLWGHKPMDETMGPHHYDCPVEYLDMVPDPGGFATAWRAKVRARGKEAVAC